jgi:hypothetical protein
MDLQQSAVQRPGGKCHAHHDINNGDQPNGVVERDKIFKNKQRQQ